MSDIMTVLRGRSVDRALGQTEAPEGLGAQEGTSGTTPIISSRNIRKVYNGSSVKVEALKGITLDIEHGEMVAIMGPSGCGKTTLLNCLSTIDDITEGTVIIEGKDITKMNDDEKTVFRAKRMGFVFQFFNLLPVLSVQENVEISLLLGGAGASEARSRALEVLEMVGIAERAKQRPAALSGGERQRVAIARALVNHPAIVWADEPTGNLDRKNTESIIQLMRRLNKEHGQTFVIVTHDQMVGRSCDRIIYMRDGELVMDDEDLRQVARQMQQEA